jgi:hypothetical protein
MVDLLTAASQAVRADRLVVDSLADATRALGFFDVPADRLLVAAPGVDHDRSA